MTWAVALLDTGEHYSDSEAPYIYGTGAVRSNAHLRENDPYGIKLPAGSKYIIHSTIFKGAAPGYKSFAMGAAIYITAFPGSTTAIMGGDVSSIKKHFYLTLGATGLLSVCYGTTILGSTGITIELNTHYYIEICGFRTLIANEGGVTVAVNGETVFSREEMLVNTVVENVWFNSPTSVDLYLSGIYVLNANAEQSKNLGPIWVKALSPIADGTYSELTPSTGTDHYAVVDESPPSTADYLGLADTNPAKELFSIDGLGETDAVKAICPMIYACSQTQSITAGQASIMIRQGTTDFIVAGPIDTERDNPYFSGGNITQLSGGAAWTAASIAAAEFGFRVSGHADNEMRVSQFIVLVALEYYGTGGTTKLKIAQQLIEIAFPFAGDNELPTLFEEWVESYERCLLFEIEWIDDSVSPSVLNTEYLSNIGYTSFPGDDPENTSYPDLVISMPTLFMRIDEMTQIGELIIFNGPEILGGLGAFDLWHRKAIVYQEIRCYVGKRDWIRSRFKQFFQGVITEIRYDNDGNMALSIADRSALMDKSTKTQTVYGSVFNCEPYFIGPGDPIYKLDQTDDSLDSVSDVRDNGVSLAGSPPGYTLSDGNRTLTLTTSPAGRVTFDAIKESNPIAINVVSSIISDAGFTIDDMDLDSFLNADLKVGYYIAQDSEVSFLEILRQVVNSAGGYCHFGYDGILRYYLLDLTIEPIATLTIDDVIDEKIAITEIRFPAKTLKLGYRRNWSVQDSDALAGAVSDADRQLYSTEWQYQEIDNGLNETIYPKAENIVIETLLQDSVEAESEADRRALILSERNYTLQFTMKGLQLFFRLGDNVLLDYPRYGLSGGKVAAIIGLNFKPDNFQTEITLWTTELS